MKTSKYLNILFAAAAAAACSGIPDGEYRISGRLSDVPDGTVLQLYEHDGDLLHRAATDTVAEGRFAFAGKIASPGVVSLGSGDEGFPSCRLELWVAPGEETEVVGHGRLIGTWEVRSDIPQQAEENGYRAVVAAQTDTLMRQLLAEQTVERGPRKDSLRAARLRTDERIAAKTVDYMRTAPVTPLWTEKFARYASFLQYGYYSGSREALEALFHRLPEAQRQSEQGRRIDAWLHPLPTVGPGDTMADDDLYDPEGGRHRLAELAGKYILLDFWSEGCGPCLRAAPELDRVAELHAGRLVAVSVSLDEKEERWRRFVAGQDSKGLQWRDPRGTAGLYARYRGTALPWFVLIAPDGRIEAVWDGYAEGELLQITNEKIG